MQQRREYTLRPVGLVALKYFVQRKAIAIDQGAHVCIGVVLTSVAIPFFILHWFSNNFRVGMSSLWDDEQQANMAYFLVWQKQESERYLCSCVYIHYRGIMTHLIHRLEVAGHSFGWDSILHQYELLCSQLPTLVSRQRPGDIWKLCGHQSPTKQNF